MLISYFHAHLFMGRIYIKCKKCKSKLLEIVVQGNYMWIEGKKHPISGELLYALMHATFSCPFCKRTITAKGAEEVQIVE